MQWSIRLDDGAGDNYMSQDVSMVCDYTLSTHIYYRC